MALTSDDITSGTILLLQVMLQLQVTLLYKAQGTTTTVTSNTLDVADINITIADEPSLYG